MEMVTLLSICRRRLSCGARNEVKKQLGGSVFSDDRIRVFAEYTTFGEEWAESHLEKQNTYQKEFVDVDGRKAKIRSWCWATPETKFKCQAELIISDVPKNWAKLAVDVKHQRDLELARRIFQTVSLP